MGKLKYYELTDKGKKLLEDSYNDIRRRLDEINKDYGFLDDFVIKEVIKAENSDVFINGKGIERKFNKIKFNIIKFLIWLGF